MAKSREKKKKRKLKMFLWYIFACLLIGMAMGFLTSTYPQISIINKILDGVLHLGIFLAALVASLMVHIIFHEFGHLVFGLLSGYKFVSFRIGFATLVIEDKKFKLKKFNIPGTAGQCLMMPPDLEDGKFPFIIYNLGGVLMNLMLVVMSGVLFFRLSLPYNMIPLAFIISGLFILITNGIPLKINGIPNDTYNIRTMIRDEESRMNFYHQLRINELLTFGTRPGQIELDNLGLEGIGDLSNPINTSMKLIEYEYYLDRLEMEKAEEAINSLLPHLNKLVYIYRNEINIERMFLELIGDGEKSFIDRLYTKNLKKYIEQAKFMVNKKRFLVAYELYYNEDRTRALEVFEELKLLAKDYPVRGEAEMEIHICQWMLGREKISGE